MRLFFVVDIEFFHYFLSIVNKEREENFPVRKNV